MEVYRSKYVVRTLEQGSEILNSVWLETTASMNDEDFKTEMLALVDSVLENETVLLLSNTKDLRFAIDPFLQRWGTDTITPLMDKTRLEKQAIIIPEEIIAQLGMDQTVDDIEKSEKRFMVKLFAATDEAKRWLLE